MEKVGTDDRRALHAAMVAAFPTYDELELFVQNYLGRSLTAIVERSGAEKAVHELLVWVESQGTWDVLLGAVAEARPHHAALGAIIGRLRPNSELPPASLPRLQRFLGRDAERNLLVSVALGGDGAAICVHGPPGAGKSTLALAVLDDERMAARFRHRRWFVRLDTDRHGAAVWGDIRQAMGLPAGPVAHDLVLQGLARGGALVLDNAESPWDKDPGGTAAVFRALSSVRGVALIVTIRGRQELPTELRWHEMAIVGLAPGAARELFAEVAHLAPREEVADALAELDHLPLAVVLLASVARKVGATEALRRWKDRRAAALVAGPGATEERHRSWAAVLETALDSPKISDGTRRMAGWLATFPEGIARQDLTALGGDDVHDEAAQLEEAGLAVRDDRGVERVRMLAPMREGIRARLADSHALLAPAMEHYIALLLQLGDHLLDDGGPAAAERLTAELGNLEVALRWSASLGQWPLVAEAGQRLVMLYRATGRGDLTWLIELFQQDPERARHSRIVAIEWIADTALDRGDIERASRMYEDARALYVDFGSLLGEANCLKGLGDVLLHRASLDEARQMYERARAAYLSVEDVPGEGICVVGLGDVALKQSALDEAAKLFRTAQHMFERVRFHQGTAGCMQRLGEIAIEVSDLPLANRLFEDGLRLFARVGDLRGEASCVCGLGMVALNAKDHATARAHLLAALGMYQRMHDPVSIGDTFRRLGLLATGTERGEHFEKARQEWTRIGRHDLVAALDRKFPP